MGSFQYRRVALLLGIGLLMPTPAGANWPTYRHDNSRSGSTEEAAPKNPHEQWTYRSPTRPIPAWDEPALWDGWSKTHDLKNRQVFDRAFQVAIVEGRVYFGSSVDDKVYCLDASTGKSKWTFFTEGPVRLAPTVVDKRVFVGSDDGFVYCLDADSGKLIWKKHPGPANRRVAGNGRVISPWAIRTSIVPVGDTVCFGAGVIPSEGVFVVALQADDGKEVWRTEMTDLPAQGYMLASETRLYVMTARDTPIVLDAKNGKRLLKVKGGTGGTYALLTGDTLLFGPNKTGDVNMVGEKQDVLASFQGNHMIVSKPWSFLQSKDELSALDREEYVKVYGERVAIGKQRSDAAKKLKKAQDSNKEDAIKAAKAELDKLQESFKEVSQRLAACIKWNSKCDCPFSLIVAGDALIAGGDGKVQAYDSQTGQQIWQRDVPGKVYGLAVSGGQLMVSTDRGVIHCFADNDRATAVNDDAQDGEQRVRQQPYAGPIPSPDKTPAEIHGPFAEFVAPNQVRISWDTTEPMTSELQFGADIANPRKWTSNEEKLYHEFIVDQVQREVVHRFKVGGTTSGGRKIETDAYRFDAFLNYLPPVAPKRPSPYAEDAKSDAIGEVVNLMLDACGARRGYALVVGAVDGRLAYELAQRSDLKIVIVEPDIKRVQRIRAVLDAAGVYGSRISIHASGLDDTRYGPFLANLIVSERMLFSGELPGSLESIYRSLRPAGGTIFLGALGNQETVPSSDKWNGLESVKWSPLRSKHGNFWTHRREKLARTGEWSHQYGSPDNSACSKDDLIQGEMMVQWWGRPGARPMPDRGSRNPPPVSANGRLYVQGNRTLFGLDAYNGAILWAKQIPSMRRANMPRDGSNMVAGEDHLYLAMGDRCVAFDGQTGARLKNFEVPEFESKHEQNWGYVSKVGSQLFGTAVRRGSQYLGDKGEWYEGSSRKEIARVTSDSLFSIDTYTGDTQWLYRRGVLINSTITISNGRIYFIESRSDQAKDADTGRLLDEVLLDQYLVAMDAATGNVIWEKPYNFSKCRYVTYMTYGNSTLLITGTDKDSVFHTYAFDAASGEELWQHQAADKKGHHTGQLAHPTIVGDLVYFNKHTYELRTGKVLGVHNFNWHGCGVMSASNHSVFSRYEYHGMLDLKTKERTEFLGIRSGCWLSLIPSGGLLLAPETSAGCSCGHSLQTSIAYVPKSLVDVAHRESSQDRE